MGIRLNLPLRDTYPHVTGNSFTATFNLPTVGLFDFEIAANENIKILDMVPTSLYFIERISFGTNMGSEAYNESIVTIPNIQFLTLKTLKPALLNTQPFVVYFNNFETIAVVSTKQDPDELLGTFRGQLKQVAATAGWPSVTANISFNIYEVQNKTWIDLFYQYNPRTAAKLARDGIALL